MTGTTSARLPSFFSTSTARPSPIAPGLTRYGLPSMSWNVCVITGKRLAAWTIAYPMRWVKEIFLPVAASWALSTLRRGDRTVAEVHRNQVAVGNDNGTVLLLSNRAARPRLRVAPHEGDARPG